MSMYLLFLSFIWAQPLEHFEGVAPGYVKFQIESTPQTRPVELIGTTNPPHLMANGKKMALKEAPHNQLSRGVYINGKKIQTQGSVGRFYHLLKSQDLLDENNKVSIVGDKTFTFALPFERLFFEKKMNHNFYFKENQAPDHWDWQGRVSNNIEVSMGNSLLPKTAESMLQFPIPLKEGETSINLTINKDGRKRSLQIPLKVKKINHSPDNFYFSLACPEESDCQKPINISFFGETLTGLTNPGQSLEVDGQKVAVNEDGFFEISQTPDCTKFDEGTFVFEFPRQTQLHRFEKKWVSTDCRRFQEKQNSLFYVSFGLGHFGVLDSPANGVQTMFSEQILPSPRLGFGVSIYRGVYFDVRMASIDSFVSGDRDHRVNNMALNAYSLGFPYRGRWFGGVGMATFKPNYNRRNDPNFMGSQSFWAAGLFFEGGHRYFLSPSWTLNSRLLYSPDFLSFQKEPERKWSFLLFEPIALEYHFL